MIDKTKGTKQIYGFDILKFIMAIGIVSTHTHLTDYVGVWGGNFQIPRAMCSSFLYSIFLFPIPKVLERGF